MPRMPKKEWMGISNGRRNVKYFRSNKSSFGSGEFPGCRKTNRNLRYMLLPSVIKDITRFQMLVSVCHYHSAEESWNSDCVQVQLAFKLQ